MLDAPENMLKNRLPLPGAVQSARGWAGGSSAAAVGSGGDAGDVRPNGTDVAPQVPESGTLIVSAGVKFQGKVMGATRVVVDGHLLSEDLEARDLVVGMNGLFEGQSTVETVHVEGVFRGRLVASQSVVLEKSAEFQGSMNYSGLRVEFGAVVQGSLSKETI